MLDFDDSPVSEKPNPSHTNESALVIFHNQDFQQSLHELLCCEGVAAKRYQAADDKSKGDELSKILIDSGSSLIFYEVCDNLLEQAEKLNLYLSRKSHVVLVGKENQISITRQLERLGFYYLLWPAERYDISLLIERYHQNLRRNHSPQKSRRALRVAVTAPKGGSGCTMVAAELAHNISEETRQPGILVDHDYHASNVHIMLGKPDLPRQALNNKILFEPSLDNSLDFIGASELLTRISPSLDYLGFEHEQETSRNCSSKAREISHSAVDTLSRDTSFIIEDFSASTDFHLQPADLIQSSDCVVVVIHASLSGLFKAGKLLKQLNHAQSSSPKKCRLILVLNHCQPSEQIRKQTAEQYLKQPISIELPWYAKCEELLTSGKHFRDGKTRLTRPFRNLARQLLGKPAATPSVIDRLMARVYR